MAFKVFEITINTLKEHNILRCDVKYLDWISVQNTNIINCVKLKHLLKGYFKGFAFKGDDFLNTGETYVLKGVDIVEDFEIDFNNIGFLSDDFNSDTQFQKFKLSKGDIVVTLVGSIGKIAIVNKNIEMLLNQNNIALKLKESYNKKIISYILNYLLKQMVSKLYKTAGYAFLRIDDLFNMNFPELSSTEQQKIIEKVEPIENSIKLLKSTIKPVSEIIDEVFAHEFDFDYYTFEQLKNEKIYYSELKQFANNRDLRQSVKYHRKAGIFVIDELKKVTKKKIKDFISEPIVLGSSVSPNDYDENGDYYYVSMANIKKWRFESGDAKLVSCEYSGDNQKKTVALNDIILARSGEGTIGKVALIDDEDIQGIFADFTMRIRLKKYNPMFAYYYFRSLYFQYLVEVNKKGLGNNTNIFPSMIQEFPIIDISLDGQQRIVDEIKTELEKQEDINNQIALERAKIDEIIENSIKNS